MSGNEFENAKHRARGSARSDLFSDVTGRWAQRAISPAVWNLLRIWRYRVVAPYIRGSVLDIGCGMGTIHYFLRLPDYVGVDNSLPVLDAAQRSHPGRTFLSIDVEREPPSFDRTFDTILMLAIVEHMENWENIRRWARLLRPGGHLILTTPTPLSDIALRHLMVCPESHKHYWDRRMVERFASQMGLQIKVYKTFQFRMNQLAVLGRPDSTVEPPLKAFTGPPPMASFEYLSQKHRETEQLEEEIARTGKGA